jgi:hypothetical protein
MKDIGLLAAVLLCGLVTCFGQAHHNRRSPLSIPFDFATNQIFVKVGINGSAPTWFVVDSGASHCVIDDALAQKSNLKVESEKEGTGAGKGSVKVKITKDVVYNLPGFDLAVAESYIIDLSGQPAVIGREIGGILGYDFFAAHVADVDFDARVLTLYDAPDYQAVGDAVPFVLKKRTPYIHAKVFVGGKPSDVEVLVDSGSQDAIDADPLAQSAKRLEVVGGVGLGQEFRTVLGRADSVQIGSFSLAKPFGVTGGVQLIGTEILRRFHVAFDYPHERIFFAPSRSFTEPFPMDASGLDLRCTRDFVGFEVHDVSKNSAGERAGIRPKDVIVAINNQPASAFTLQQVTQLFGESGRHVYLCLNRNGSTREVRLSLQSRL